MITQAPIRLIALAIEKILLIVACATMCGAVRVPAMYLRYADIAAAVPLTIFVLFTVWKPFFQLLERLANVTSKLPDVIAYSLTQLRFKAGRMAAAFAKYLQSPDVH